MKKIIVLIYCLVVQLNADSQQPVEWKIEIKKISTHDFELNITALIERGWHIYSQTTPAYGPLPTSIEINRNPILLYDKGVLEERGKLLKKYESIFDVDVHYYKEKVVFARRIKLRANSKTKLSGKIEFMACNSSMCMPPQIEEFTIGIE